MPPKPPPPSTTTPGWLSSDQLRAAAAAAAHAQAPRGKISGGKAFQQAKQTNLLAFYPKEPAGGGMGAARASRSSSASVGKGKGRELSNSASEDDQTGTTTTDRPRKKARASEPLPRQSTRLPSSSPPPPPPTTTAAGSSSSRPPAKRPRQSEPAQPTMRSLSSAPPSRLTVAGANALRCTTGATATPPPSTRVKREAHVDLQSEPPWQRQTRAMAHVKEEAPSQLREIAQAQAGPRPSSSRRATSVKPEPASLGPPSAADAAPNPSPSSSPSTEAYDDDLHQPSYHRPTSLLSASLAPFLPASYPSPQRLPQHVLDDLSTIGRPFGGPNGHEKFLRRPRMPWETDDMWEGRQRDLREWEAGERARKERERRPLEPPARGLGTGSEQGRKASPQPVDEEDEDNSEPDTYFLGGPKKLRWPKPPLVPQPRPTLAPTVGDPSPPQRPLSLASSSSEKGYSQQQEEESCTILGTLPYPPPVAWRPAIQDSSATAPEPDEEESYTIPPTQLPYPPPSRVRLGVDEPDCLNEGDRHDGTTEDEVSQTVDPAHAVRRRSQRGGTKAPSVRQSPSLTAPALVHPPASAPRRLTDEEETSVILSLDARPTVSPERPPSPPVPPLPRPVEGRAEVEAHDDVVPSSQTEEVPSSFALRSHPTEREKLPQAKPGILSQPQPRILVLASQETSSPPSTGSITTPRRMGLSTSQPLPSSASRTATPPRRLFPSNSQPSPWKVDVETVTPRRRLAASQSQPAPSVPNGATLTTPTHRRLRADDSDIVPTSEPNERKGVRLVPGLKSGVIAPTSEENSPSPTPIRQPSAHPPHQAPSSTGKRSVVDKGKGRAKPRASWPVWTGAGLVDLDEPAPAQHDVDYGGPVSTGVPPALTASRPLIQDSLLQHGFGRSTSRVARAPTPDEPVPAEEALTDEEDNVAPLMEFGESIVPSSQSLAPLGWGVTRHGEQPIAGISGKKVGRVPSPPPRAILTRPLRRKPPPPPPTDGPVVIDLVSIPDSQPQVSPPLARTDPDVTLVNVSQRLRSSSPSTSEDDDDEVDADVTLHAPLPTMALSQADVPDSQPQRAGGLSSPKPITAVQSRPVDLIESEPTPESLFDFLRSSTSSSEVDLGSP